MPPIGSIQSVRSVFSVNLCLLMIRFVSERVILIAAHSAGYRSGSRRSQVGALEIDIARRVPLFSTPVRYHQGLSSALLFRVPGKKRSRLCDNGGSEPRIANTRGGLHRMSLFVIIDAGLAVFVEQHIGDYLM